MAMLLVALILVTVSLGIILAGLCVRNKNQLLPLAAAVTLVFAFPILGYFVTSDIRLTPMNRDDLKTGVIYDTLYVEADAPLENVRRYVLLRWTDADAKAKERIALFEFYRTPPPKFIVDSKKSLVALELPVASDEK